MKQAREEMASHWMSEHFKVEDTDSIKKCTLLHSVNRRVMYSFMSTKR